MSRVLIAVLLATVTCSRATCQLSWENEPNNSSATAMSVPTGTHVESYLAPGEDDWFSFSLLTPQHVNIFLSATDGFDADTVLELIDLTSNQTLAFDDDTLGLQSALSLTLAPGSYAARVTGFDPLSQGAYSIDIAVRPSSVAGIYEDATSEANNDTSAGAIDVTSTCAFRVVAYRPNDADQDWYKVTLSQQSGVWFTIEEGDESWITQYRWECYQEVSGQVVPVSTHLGAAGGNNIAAGRRTSLVRCWPAGTYYLRILQRSSIPNADFDKVRHGSYSLTTLLLPMNTTSQTLTVPANTTFGSAQPIGEGDLAGGSMTATSTADWYRVSLTSVGSMMVQTRDGATPRLTDTTIQLYDAKQQLIGTATGGNLLANQAGQSHARMLATLGQVNQPTDYFIKVTGAGPTPVGNYLLEIGLAGCTPYLVAGAGKKDLVFNCTTSGGPRIEYGPRSIFEVPVLGSTFVTEALDLPFPFWPNTLVIRLAGFSDTFGPFGPLPTDLGPLGAPGCSLEVSPDVLEAYVFTFGSPALMVRPIPSAPALLGAMLYEQVAAFDTVNPLGLVTSNAMWYRLGERPFGF